MSDGSAEARSSDNEPPVCPETSVPRAAGVVLARLVVRALVVVVGLAAVAVAYWLVRMGLRWLGAPLFFTIERS